MIDVLLLTGYLGAGKTTLLNHLLTLPGIADVKKALIINEFGSLGIDGQLVQQGDYDIIELNKGSVFCICVKTDFIKSLTRIAEEINPELLIIEATGVAETRDIEEFMNAPGLAGRFRISANLCIVDALNFTKVAPNLKAAPIQVAWADGIILNKIDLVTVSEQEILRKVLMEINAAAPVCGAEFGKIPYSFMESLTHTRKEGTPSECPPETIFSRSFTPSSVISRDGFYALIESYGESILRLKGTVDFGDGPVFIEKAGSDILEKDASPYDPGFVIIAWNISPDELAENVNSVIS